MLTTKIAGVAAALALIAAPATAAAHDGHHHGRHHHHHVRKAHVREVTGAATATVASFADGDLTLALPSGRSFTAAVTRRTEIECVTAAPQATTSRHGGGDDDGGDGRNHDAGDDHGDDGPNHDVGDDHGDDDANARCASTNLVAGAKVSIAKLSVLGGDATWKKVVIVK